MSSHLDIHNYNKDFCLCSKYIIPLLKNESETREFWRFFLSKCKEFDVPSSILPQVVSAAYNGNLGLNVDTDYLMTYEGEVRDLPELIDFILYDISKNETEFKDCRPYCARVLYGSDKVSKSALCKVCEKFNKQDYCNRLIDEDYSLIKYIASSQDNLDKFMRQVGMLRGELAKNPFTSRIELTREMLSYTLSPPVVISVFNSVYTALCVSASQHNFFSSGVDVEARLRTTAFYNSVCGSLMKRDGYFKTYFDNYGDAWRTRYDIFVDDVINSADIFNDDQFSDVIRDHIQYYWTSRKERTSTTQKERIADKSLGSGTSVSTQITLFDLLESAREEELFAKKKEEKDYAVLETAPPADGDISIVDEEPEVVEFAEPEEAASGVTEGSVTTNNVSGEVPADEPSVEKDAALRPEETPAEQQEESTMTGTPVGVKEDGALSFDVDDDVQQATSPVEEHKRTAINRRPEGAGGSGRADTDIYVPHYPVYHSEDIEQVFRSVFTEKNIYLHSRSVKKENGSYAIDILSLESLYVDSEGWILAFTSPSDDKVWFCPIKDVPIGLRMLLESEHVTKLCYEPYILYSSLRNVDIRAKGIYSLFNINNYLNIKRDIKDIASMEKVYLGISHGNAPVDNYSMTMLTREQIKEYEQLYVFQNIYIKDNKKEQIRKQLYRDEILGYSYMRETYLLDESVLFIRGEKGLVFNNNYVHSPVRAGYFVTYYLRTGSLTDAQKQRLYLYFLSELLAKGLEKKYDFYIVTLSSGVMTLFIAKDSYSTITGMIHERMDNFAIDNELDKYVLDVVEEYIDVTEGMTDDEKFERAVRYNDRMNEMRKIHSAADYIDKNALDINASIEVPEHHIRTDKLDKKDD